MPNPYDDFSGERYDVEDLKAIITASKYNLQQETLRRIIYGSEFETVTAVLVAPEYYRTGRLVVKDGFDYENAYFKGAESLLFVSSNDDNPPAVFQQHCLTERGHRRRIIVDSGLSLGNQGSVNGNTVNSNTTIELATFDHIGNAYKEFHIGGFCEEAATIGSISGGLYPITFATAPDLYKINAADMILFDDGGVLKWGEVDHYDPSNSNVLWVNLFAAPSTTPDTYPVYCLKRNITFINCRFRNQVMIPNTYNCKFINCVFEFDGSTMLGGIVADYLNLGVGANNLGYTFYPYIHECLFILRDSNMATNIATKLYTGALPAFVKLDRSQECNINNNTFVYEAAGNMTNNSAYPVNANNGIANPGPSGGIITGNNIGNAAKNWAVAPVGNIDTRFGYVGVLYNNYNVLNGGTII